MPKTEIATRPWKLGGCSGRMVTTEKPYFGDGFLADFDTLANAKHAVDCVNQHDDLVRQRDALLAACREWVAWTAYTPEAESFLDPVEHDILRKSRAAIDLCEKGGE